MGQLQYEHKKKQKVRKDKGTTRTNYAVVLSNIQNAVSGNSTLTNITNLSNDQSVSTDHNINNLNLSKDQICTENNGFTSKDNEASTGKTVEAKNIREITSYVPDSPINSAITINYSIDGISEMNCSLEYQNEQSLSSLEISELYRKRMDQYLNLNLVLSNNKEDSGSESSVLCN